MDIVATTIQGKDVDIETRVYAIVFSVVGIIIYWISIETILVNLSELMLLILHLHLL